VKAAVLEHGADLGLAVDGDADRCLAVDASGAEVDGDQLMAILALAMREAGTHHLAKRLLERQRRPGDRGAASTAIGVKNVAINPQSMFPQKPQIDHHP
jgi:hypothetical protein